jgi:hypothetical protein
MGDAMKTLPIGSELDKVSPPHSVFSAWRLQAYGYAVAVIYAAFLISVHRAGTWIVDGVGVPIYTDFASQWAAAVQAMHGSAASLSTASSEIWTAVRCWPG